MKIACLGLMGLWVAGGLAAARMSPSTTDDVLVSSSEVIVVGHVEGGFAFLSPPSAQGMKFMSPHYRAVLIVTETLRGKIPIGPMPVIIHAPLRPVVLNAKMPHGEEMTEELPTAGQDTGPQVPVGLFYPSTDFGMPPTGDIRKDQIWFLRRNNGRPEDRPEDASVPGVWSQQDVRPLERKAYFVAVMSGDPDALTPFTQGTSWQAEQARQCQARLRVEKLDQIPDPELRADALVAVVQGRAPAGWQLAMDKLTALGPVGLKKLVPMFENGDRAFDRRTILWAWSGTHYHEAAPLLVAWLRGEGAWWAKQTPQDMIWSFQAGQRGGSDYNDPRAVSCRNIYCAVEALWDMGGGAGAKDIIEKTRAQWAALGVRPQPGNDIVAICDQALVQVH